MKLANPEDLFVKALLASALSRAGRAETELEVEPTGKSLRADVYGEPDPALLAELGKMGLLGELFVGPILLESFSKTPGVGILRVLQYKQQLQFRALKRARRAQNAAGVTPPKTPVPFPWMVVLSPGPPRRGIAAFGLTQERAGVYAAAPGFAMRVVVLSALPKTRETLLLRLGSRKRRKAAMAELKRLPARALERVIAEPILVRYELKEGKPTTPEEETMLGSEILEEGRKIIQRERADAERKGKREMLCRQLRHRFGDLPQDTLARVGKAGTAKLELWADRVLTAQSLADVFREP